MSRKVVIILIAVVVLAVISFLFFSKGNRASPPGHVELSHEGLDISISYSRPSVKGRAIFGTEEDGALQPFGKYWRLGANEATEITFNKNVNFNGKSIDAGTYSMYAVPGVESFTIILNSEIKKSGAPEPDHNKDILRVEVPVQKATTSTEQFTISMEPMGPTINIIFDWATTRLVIPVTSQ
jgi:hypothetical protein